MVTVADRIAEWLHEKGIKAVFGIVGGGNVALWDAVTRHQKAQIVCCHHEQAAAMASAYYNRVCGGLGSAVLCTTGAGSTNTLTGVMAAFMDRVPLLVISGNEASRYMYAETRVWGVQGYDSKEVARPFTNFVVRPIAQEVISALHAASVYALKRIPGPVWVDIPKDVQNAVVR